MWNWSLGALAALTRAMDSHPFAAVANPAIRGDWQDEAFDPGADPAVVTWLPGASGAAMFLRLEALRRVGAFEPKYFLYYEDSDLLCRLKRAGWELLKVRSALARHEGQGSAKRLFGGAKLLHYMVRNCFLWVKRNRWEEGPWQCFRILCSRVGSEITLRRLVHPTRLVALVSGLAIGIYLLVTTSPLPHPTPEMGPDQA